MQYNIILWDADDTLLDFKAAEKKSFEKTMREAGLPSGEEYHCRYCAYNNALWQEFNEGTVTKEFLLVERFRRYLKEIGADKGPEREPYLLNERYLDNLSRCPDLLPEAYETVKALDGMGASQYIVTNAVSFVNRRRVKDSRIAPFIKDIFVSEEIGFSKPDRRYYERVSRRIDGFCADRTITVGDSLFSDILGGIHAGIAACYYNPGKRRNASQIRPDYEISALHELTQIAEGRKKTARSETG